MTLAVASKVSLGTVLAPKGGLRTGSPFRQVADDLDEGGDVGHDRNQKQAGEESIHQKPRRCRGRSEKPSLLYDLMHPS